jgi:sirohydrochlorin ferrochelatase
LQGRFGFKEMRTGFVEQEPWLKPAAKDLGQAICLPFFALVAGHMLDDVPEALEEADFAGPVLASFIDWAGTAQVIATALAAEQARQEEAVP